MKRLSINAMIKFSLPLVIANALCAYGGDDWNNYYQLQNLQSELGAQRFMDQADQQWKQMQLNSELDRIRAQSGGGEIIIAPAAPELPAARSTVQPPTLTGRLNQVQMELSQTAERRAAAQEESKRKDAEREVRQQTARQAEQARLEEMNRIYAQQQTAERMAYDRTHATTPDTGNENAVQKEIERQQEIERLQKEIDQRWQELITDPLFGNFSNDQKRELVDDFAAKILSDDHGDYPEFSVLLREGVQDWAEGTKAKITQQSQAKAKQQSQVQTQVQQAQSEAR